MSVCTHVIYDCVRDGDNVRVGREVRSRTHASGAGYVHGCEQMSLVRQLCGVGYTLVCAAEGAHMCGGVGSVATRQSPMRKPLHLCGRCARSCSGSCGIRLS